jgi:hypothetical protein
VGRMGQQRLLTPASPRADERCEIERVNADGMQHANVPQLAFGAQPVHPRRADAQLRGDLTDGEDLSDPAAW